MPETLSTATPAPTTDTSGQTQGGGILDLDIGTETTWQPVFDTFTAREQSCIRDSIDSDTLDALLAESFLEEDSTLTEEQVVQLFSCLDEETAGDLLIAAIVADAEAAGAKVGEASITCMQELLQDVDLAALFAAEDNSPEAEEFILLFFGLYACVEDPSMPDVGGQPDTSTDDHGNDGDSATAVAVGAAVGGAIDYQGDRDFFRFTAQAGQLYQIDVALGTLDDSDLDLLDSDGWDLAYNDDFGNSRASRIVWEATESGDYYVGVGGWGTGSYTLSVTILDIMDDHGNNTDGATAVAVGATTGGVIDYEGDRDYFRFTAQAGQLYQIDVALGTLEDSQVDLRDSNDWELAYNDDFGDFRASRIIWEAPESGDYYVLVSADWGSSTGSYTLSVSLSAIVDDHGNNVGGATAVSVGSAVQGSLDYDGDRDFFAFEAQAGTVYRIDVTLGTLDDSVVELLNADGWNLEYNDDFGDSPASLVVWAAPESGDFYVVVSAGWGSANRTGTYTLTITVP